MFNFGKSKKAEKLEKLEATSHSFETFARYCRTRKMADPYEEKVGVSFYYEACLGKNGIWKLIKVYSLSDMEKEGEMRDIQTVIKESPSLGPLLEEMHCYENGATSLEMTFLNNTFELGMDYFHSLVHAEGWGFDRQGKLVQAVNGRFAEDGSFLQSEKERLYTAHLNAPRLSREISRGSLQEFFLKAAKVEAGQNILDLKDQRISLDKKKMFFKNFYNEVVELSRKNRLFIEACNSALKEPNGAITSFGSNEEIIKFRCFNIDVEYKKESKPKDRNCFCFSSYQNGEGPVFFDVFPKVAAEQAEKVGIVLPDVIKQQLLELRVYSSYLTAKILYFLYPEKYKDIIKAAFAYSMDLLEQHIDALPQEVRPNVKDVEALIMTKREEKVLPLVRELQGNIKKCQDDLETAQRYFENQTANNLKPKKHTI